MDNGSAPQPGDNSVQARLQRLRLLQGQLQQSYQPYQATHQKIAERLCPMRPRWLVSDSGMGDQGRMSSILDPTAMLALKTLASGIAGNVTSQARPWIRLSLADQEKGRSYAVKDWLDKATAAILKAFSRSNLYNRFPSLYADFGGFGTAAMQVDDDPKSTVRLTNLPIGSYLIAAGADGRVDTIFRRFTMTVRQMAQEYGRDKLSKVSQRMLETSQGEVQVVVVHAIYPNPMAGSSPLATGKRFASCHYEEALAQAELQFLRESGYDEFPVVVPRWETVGEDVWGIGPGHEAYGLAGTLNALASDEALLAERMADPAMLVPGVLRGTGVSFLPGRKTYVDSREGQLPQAKPVYEPRADALTAVGAMTQDRRRAVNQIFFTNLFLALTDVAGGETRRTAEEIRAIVNERLVMLGPALGRLDNECFNPLVDLTFSALVRQSQPLWARGQDGPLPQPPVELHGVDLRVEYLSELHQASKALGLNAINRLVGVAIQLSQAIPSAVQTVADTLNIPAIMAASADGLGTPTNMLNDPKDVAKMAAQRAADAQAQARADQMAKLATAAQNLNTAPIEPGSPSAQSVLGGS